jgi:hypothetical protein
MKKVEIQMNTQLMNTNTWLQKEFKLHAKPYPAVKWRISAVAMATPGIGFFLLL